MPKFVQAITTVRDEEEGKMLARRIVKSRLAAGAQLIGPIWSTYWWHRQLEEAQEWQIIVITTMDRLAEVEQYIKTHHSYVTPEIIATPIVAGSREYLQWISDETRPFGVSQ